MRLRQFVKGLWAVGCRPLVYIVPSPIAGVAKLWTEGQIRDCLATGGSDTVRFTWQAAANAVALLSTVGNVVLEKMCKVYGGPDQAGWFGHYSVAICRPHRIFCSFIMTAESFFTVWSVRISCVKQGSSQLVRGAISVIFRSQISLRVHCCKKDKVHFTTLLWQNNGQKNGLMSRMLFSELYKIMVNKVALVGFRAAIAAPPGSGPGVKPSPNLLWPTRNTVWVIGSSLSRGRCHLRTTSRIAPSAAMKASRYMSWGIQQWLSTISLKLVFFRPYTEMCLKYRKKSSHFGQNVWKYWLKTLLGRVLIQLRQMTEMFQRKKNSGWSESNPDLWLCQRAAPKKFNKKSNDMFCFMAEGSLLHKIMGLLKDAEGRTKVLGSCMRPSELWLRTTGVQ